MAEKTFIGNIPKAKNKEFLYYVTQAPDGTCDVYSVKQARGRKKAIQSN